MLKKVVVPVETSAMSSSTHNKPLHDACQSPFSARNKMMMSSDLKLTTIHGISRRRAAITCAKTEHWQRYHLFISRNQLISRRGMMRCLVSSFLLGTYTVIATDSHIGDGVRSASSSSSFFKSVDRDGDGLLRASEVANFLTHSIGGSAFDTSSEVDTEVSNVMRTLDQNRDDGLDKSDVMAHWTTLESLLTADEVAEWVEHAVQLPEDVAQLFKKNVVTGYDFPELVENDGSALLTDLGIEKSSFRKKLVKHISARMLGIGDIPSPPTKVKHKLESCSTISFTWDKSLARGFPVHSYRVQRRAVEIHGGYTRSTLNSSNDYIQRTLSQRTLSSCAGACTEEELTEIVTGDISTESLVDSDLASRTFPTCDWVTVYSGGETSFHDSWLDRHHKYIYRLQAWNNVGRSQWVEVDVSKSQRKQKCIDTNANNKKRELNLLDGHDYHGIWNDDTPSLFLVYQLVTFFVRLLFTLTAVAAALMRWKRASAASTMLTNVTRFPCLWTAINSFSLRFIGVEVVPRHMISDSSATHDTDGLDIHDKCTKAKNLDGYKTDKVFDEGDTPETRRVKFRAAYEKAESCSSLDNSVENPRGRRGNLKKAHSQSNIKTDGRKFPREMRRQKSQPLLLPRRAPSPLIISGVTNQYSSKIEMGICMPCEEQSIRSTLTTESASGSIAGSEDDDDTENYIDDHTRCNTCRKKYHIRKRW
eukprot:CAMPEP_0172522172 /NCGR_PEP_ID=MMETSP1066-20121228/292977_1 /TAXON_ID=671091 /ORGANISM="Coscinodiscus wailesii, Strain CCMP2513" /LENGTH=703 /DNA_ID=CAMNT_0013305147 /DNA_START=247 /DNA_END=2355 /DNA_ORIENTATION=+